MPAEKVRLRIGNVAKAVLVSGQAYQDPKDALNEFVSNAADEYTEPASAGRIRVVLRRRGRAPVLAVDDDGRGMCPDRLARWPATCSSRSSRATAARSARRPSGCSPTSSSGDAATSSAGGGIERDVGAAARPGPADGQLERDAAASATSPGRRCTSATSNPTCCACSPSARWSTTCALGGDAALAAGAYTIEVVEGRLAELVTPDRPEGIKLEIPARTTLWGRIEFSLYVAPSDGRHRRVAVVGRAGTTIIDDLAELDEFAAPPWTTDQVSGQMVFEALPQSAGRRAILRDRDAFPVFVEMVRSIEPAVVASSPR